MFIPLLPSAISLQSGLPKGSGMGEEIRWHDNKLNGTEFHWNELQRSQRARRTTPTVRSLWIWLRVLVIGVLVRGVVSNFLPAEILLLGIACSVRENLRDFGLLRFAVLWLGDVCVSRVGLYCATYTLSPLTYASPYARLGVRVCDLQDTPTLHPERNSVPFEAFVLLDCERAWRSWQTTPRGRVYHRLDNNAIYLTTIFAQWHKGLGRLKVRMCKHRCKKDGVIVNVPMCKNWNRI